MAFQCFNYFLHQIIYIEQFHLHTAVVNLYGQVVGDVVAEGGYGRIIIWPAPFAEEVRKAIDQYLGSRLLAVLEHQFLARLLALAVFAGAKSACKGGLDGRTYHHGAVVLVLLQCVEQCGGKSEVALHELLRVLRTIYSGKIEDEITITTPLVELFGSGIKVVLIDGINLHVTIPTCLAFLYIIELGAEVLAYKTLGTGH